MHIRVHNTGMLNMKRQQHHTDSLDRSLDLQLLEEDDFDSSDPAIDTLIHDGGYLADCLRDHLRHVDATEIVNEIQQYVH